MSVPHPRHPTAARLVGLFLGGSALFPSGQALADAAATIGAQNGTHSIDGQVIYQQVCQACHQADARGAVGAGIIPALAGNPKLRSASYPVYIVLNGYGGMPWLSSILTDTQVASVVNYVRSHFGNNYTDAVAPSDVAAVRGPEPVVGR